MIDFSKISLSPSSNISMIVDEELSKCYEQLPDITDKTAGAVLGVQGSPCPSESPIKFMVSLNGMGCITYGKPGKMCIYIPTHMRER